MRRIIVSCLPFLLSIATRRKTRYSLTVSDRTVLYRWSMEYSTIQYSTVRCRTVPFPNRGTGGRSFTSSEC
ncbi:hypothetical protein BJV74DRAFT_277201 [Russula compacta]|nr:hypothetical protein BJV74DRAFT_277201 [Russula compacta]